MIAVDTNILVYADREESALHAAALQAVRRLAEGNEAWAIPVFCLGEFLRVVFHDPGRAPVEKKKGPSGF